MTADLFFNVLPLIVWSYFSGHELYFHYTGKQARANPNIPTIWNSNGVRNLDLNFFPKEPIFIWAEPKCQIETPLNFEVFKMWIQIWIWIFAA